MLFQQLITLKIHTGMEITLLQSEQLLDKAKAKAIEIGIPMNIVMFWILPAI